MVGFVLLMAFLVYITIFDIARLGGTPDPGAAGLRSKAALPGRRETPTVDVGGVPVGAAHPVVVQSMTNTDTADADATALQVAALAHAGSELVRVTVNNDAAAAAVPEIGAQARRPGHRRAARRRLPLQRPSAPGSITRRPRRLDKYRINPGNVGGQATRRALRHHRPGGRRARQAGAHRRQLGLARPGPADRDDGRQRPRRRAPRPRATS